jgi:hypothetical protein
MMDENKIMQYVALGMVATFSFIGTLLWIVIDRTN